MATIVQMMVTRIESRVVVEQPQPRARVRSSKRSDARGQTFLLIGSSREDAGMQVDDC